MSCNSCPHNEDYQKLQKAYRELLGKNIRFIQTENRFDNHIILQFDFSDLVNLDEILEFAAYRISKEYERLFSRVIGEGEWRDCDV